MKKIVFVIFFLFLSACSQVDKNTHSNKDLTIVCSGTNSINVKSFAPKIGKFNDEIHIFKNGKLIYNDYDIEKINRDSKPIELNIGCNWTKDEITCNGTLLDNSNFDLYLNRISGRIATNMEGGKYGTTYTSEGKCEVSTKRKF